MRTLPGEAGCSSWQHKPGAVHRAGADEGGWAAAAVLVLCDRVQVVLYPVCASRRQASGRGRGQQGWGRPCQAGGVLQEHRTATLCVGVQDMATLVPFQTSWGGFLGQAFGSPFDLSLKMGKLRPRDTGFAWIPQCPWAQWGASPGNPEGIPAPEVSIVHKASE